MARSQTKLKATRSHTVNPLALPSALSPINQRLICAVALTSPAGSCDGNTSRRGMEITTSPSRNGSVATSPKPYSGCSDSSTPRRTPPSRSIQDMNRLSGVSYKACIKPLAAKTMQTRNDMLWLMSRAMVKMLPCPCHVDVRKGIWCTGVVADHAEWASELIPFLFDYCFTALGFASDLVPHQSIWKRLKRPAFSNGALGYSCTRLRHVYTDFFTGGTSERL